MNKKFVLKVMEIAPTAFLFIGFLFLLAAHISNHPIWLILANIFVIVATILLGVQCVLQARIRKKMRYVIGAIVGFALAVFSICVAIGII